MVALRSLHHRSLLALRLAKFNLDERQTTSFIGVPTPANALFWGSLIVFNPSWLKGMRGRVFIISGSDLITSYLLVCEMLFSP